MRIRHGRISLRNMAERTYAVYWNEGADGLRCAGRMQLAASFAELAGRRVDGRRCLDRLRYDEIASVRYERRRLHVQRRSGRSLQIGSVDGPGALHELGPRLQAALAPA